MKNWALRFECFQKGIIIHSQKIRGWWNVFLLFSGKRSQQKPGYVNGHEIRFITPVRRSLRIEKTSSRYPAVLQERDPCVSSVHELLTEDEGQNGVTRTAETPTSPLYVYRENEALREHVQIQLIYDDTDASWSRDGECCKFYDKMITWLSK